MKDQLLYVTGRILAAVVIAGVLVSTAVAQEEEKNFTRVRIDYESTSDWVDTKDVNGDGRTDILIQKGNKILAYLQKKNHTFDILRPAHRRVASLPPSVFLFDYYRTRKKNGGSLRLAGLTAGGVETVPFQKPDEKEKDNGNHSSRELITASTVFEGTPSGSPDRVDFTPDLNGDGREEFLVPERSGYRVFLRDENDRYSRQVFFPFSPFGNARMFSRLLNFKIESTVSFPKYHVGPLLAEGERQFALFVQNRLYVFRVPDVKNGETVRVKPNVIQVKNVEKRNNEVFNYLIPPEFLDLNGDGVDDLVVTVPGEGNIYIYHGGKGEKSYQKPDQIIKYSGWIVRSRFRDLTGDGPPDLVVLRMEEVGVWDALDILSSYTVNLYLQVRKNNGNGTFKDQNSFSRSVLARISLGSSNLDLRADTPFFFRMPENMMGTGTGPDLLMKSESDRVDIYAGREKGVFQDSVSRVIKTINTSNYSSTSAMCEDLTGNGRTDLLLKSQNFNRNRNLLQIYLLQNK